MLRSILISFFLFFTISTPSFSQDITPFAQEAKIIDLEQITTQLTKIKSAVEKKTVTKEETIPFIKELSGFHDDLSSVKAQNMTDMNNIQKKITALGSVPAAGEKEASDISNQRKEFNKELDTVKAKIAKIDLTLTKIDEINQLILKTRNQELLDKILIKRNSVLNINEFWKSLVNFVTFLHQLIQSPGIWYNSLTSGQHLQVQNELNVFGFGALFVLVSALFINWILRRKFGYNVQTSTPNYSQKVVTAIFMIIARGVVPATIPGSFILWFLHHQDLFTGSFGIMLNTAAYYTLYLCLFCAIVTALFTPQNPKWRLIEVNNEKAKSLSTALIFSILILCLFSFFHVIAIRLESSDDIIYVLKMLENGVKAGCIILISYRFLYNNFSLTDEELNEDNIQGLTTSSKISLLISMLALIVFCFSLFGYIRLSEYIFNRFLISIGFIGICYIIRKLAIVLFHQLMEFRFWGRKLRINKHGIGKIEFWFNFTLTTILGIFTTLALLAIWGISVDIMLQNIKKFLTGFDIGDMHVSIISIILGIVSFFITLFIVKLVKNSLLNGNLSKIDMDPGVRNSLAALIGFFGIITASLLTISIMGGSLKGLTIAAGALSFGAGLGLQNIVNNFVSGLILLFERPIKIGDWVIINEYEGIIKQINMRSTQLETFNKANVIIPNATLLSTSLINLTYKNKTGRINIPVGVGYDSDVSRVQEILLDVAKNTKNVLANPAPFVVFKALGENSLDFQLSCYTSDVNNKLSIQTSILENILIRFKHENIDIPFPQRVIHIQKEKSEDASILLSQKTFPANKLKDNSKTNIDASTKKGTHKSSSQLKKKEENTTD